MKKIMKFLLFMITTALFSLSSPESSAQVLNLQKNIHRARASFEDVYYELLKNNYFNEYYNNNLIINTDTQGDFYENGIVLFKLIEWLQQNDSRDSRFLLKRMNKLFYLEFYRFICKMDQEKTRDGVLFELFSKIFYYKVPSVHVGNTPVPPFQTTLTKATLLIFTMNSANMYYDAKRESLIFALDAIRQEMLDINATLGDHKIDDHEIRKFFAKLQAHATQEPIVKPGSIKKIVIGAAVITVCIGLVYLALKHINVTRQKIDEKEDKPVLDEKTQEVVMERVSLGTYINDEISRKWRGCIKWTAGHMGTLGEKVGEKLAVGAGNAMSEKDKDGSTVLKPVVIRLAADGGRSLLRGIATKGKDYEPIPEEETNPILKKVGEEIVEGALGKGKKIADQFVGPVVKKAVKVATKQAIKDMDPAIKKFTEQASKEVGKVVKPAVSAAQRQAKNNVKGWLRGIPVIHRLVADDEPENDEPESEGEVEGVREGPRPLYGPERPAPEEVDEDDDNDSDEESEESEEDEE